MLCPCQSQLTFSECCQTILEGKKPALTAEALMRARYTAFTQGNMKFILSSHDPKTRGEFDSEATRQWAESLTWTGLEIINTKEGLATDKVGYVEFKAHYKNSEGPDAHHELSEFKKRKGVWYFSAGKNPEVQPFQRVEPKIGRNDPCSCGSGEKYKKCCGR